MSHLTAVALSGGVDSAVALALLRRQGDPLLAVHLRLADQGEGELRAGALAATLGVPFVVVDLRVPFQEAVVRYFTRTYAQGLTPNPCVQCNAAIKFGVLWDKVRNLGATHLATGHYVRLLPLAEGGVGLFRGVQPGKDQSYFLQRLPRELLPRLRFPLGAYRKEEVRRCFRELVKPGFALPPESQEICFIPAGDYKEFLRLQAGLAAAPGEIVDRKGRFRGRHPGLLYFTVGQRRGLGLPDREPLYVLELQPATNRLVVGPKAELLAAGLRALQPNWLIPPPEEAFTATAVIRYRHPGVEAEIQPQGDGAVRVRFATPQAAVAPGQAVAFYDGDRLLGGAWIDAALKD